VNGSCKVELNFRSEKQNKKNRALAFSLVSTSLEVVEQHLGHRGDVRLALLQQLPALSRQLFHKIVRVREILQVVSLQQMFLLDSAKMSNGWLMSSRVRNALDNGCEQGQFFCLSVSLYSFTVAHLGKVKSMEVSVLCSDTSYEPSI
jgi:hypothetical protein